MFGWDEAHEDYRKVESENKAELSHEILAGGASFYAMKKFEDHQRDEGKPVSHEFAKELIAGFAGAEVDRLAETKGMDFVDKERREHTQRQAQHKAKELYEQHYEQQGGNEFRPNEHRPHRRMQEAFPDRNW